MHLLRGRALEMYRETPVLRAISPITGGSGSRRPCHCPPAITKRGEVAGRVTGGLLASLRWLQVGVVPAAARGAELTSRTGHGRCCNAEPGVSRCYRPRCETQLAAQATKGDFRGWW